MGKKRCSVDGCRARNIKEYKGVTFFAIERPQNKAWEAQLIKAVKREADSKFNLANSFICSKHFEPSCLKGSLKRTLLHHGSLPTLHLEQSADGDVSSDEEMATSDEDTEEDRDDQLRKTPTNDPKLSTLKVNGCEDAQRKIDLLQYLLSSSVTDGAANEGEELSDLLDQSCKGLRKDPNMPTMAGKTCMINAVNKLFILLRETLLTHRWTEVVQVLVALTREQRSTSSRSIMEALWKGSCHVFIHDEVARQNSHQMEKLVNQFKLFSDLSTKEVLLEFIFFLMTEGRLLEAQHALKTVVKFKGPRKRETERSKVVDVLMVAYEGMIWFLEWLEEKKNLDRLQTQPDSTGIFNLQQETIHELIMKTHADKACACFASLNGVKGVWDVFITKHVLLLEHYSKDDEAVDVLQSYCRDNPDNPNAHVFLYNHLKTDVCLKIDILKRLRKLSPSDHLMLDLHNLLKDSGCGVGEVFNIIFNMLDYPCNKDSKELWEVFAANMADMISDKESISDNKAFWDAWHSRDSWWPLYHFDTDVVGSCDVGVLAYKAAVAWCILGPENEFTKLVESMDLDDQQRDLLEKFKTLNIIKDSPG